MSGQSVEAVDSLNLILSFHCIVLFESVRVGNWKWEQGRAKLKQVFRAIFALWGLALSAIALTRVGLRN
ncbi:MAG: hypothetical protein LRZ84_09655 [Desertifilum sp.]|nr:hypothetical protein [Desertifilum sp.]